MIAHIDRVFSGFYKFVKRSRKLKALSNCVLVWKEKKSQKDFFGIRLYHDKYECFKTKELSKTYVFESENKIEFRENQDLFAYDQALVLDLEIQRLQRKDLEHYLYLNGKRLEKDEILKIFYPKKAIEKGLL